MVSQIIGHSCKQLGLVHFEPHRNVIGGWWWGKKKKKKKKKRIADLTDMYYDLKNIIVLPWTGSVSCGFLFPSKHQPELEHSEAGPAPSWWKKHPTEHSKNMRGASVFFHISCAHIHSFQPFFLRHFLSTENDDTLLELLIFILCPLWTLLQQSSASAKGTRLKMCAIWEWHQVSEDCFILAASWYTGK